MNGNLNAGLAESGGMILVTNNDTQAQMNATCDL